MSLINKYELNVDIKRRFERVVPTFRSGDSVQLIFKMFDNGEEINIDSATEAYLYQRTPSGVNLRGNCYFDTIDGKRVIKYDYEKIAMIEFGYNIALLVVMEGNTAISIQPFVTLILDENIGGAGSYAELILELIRRINELMQELQDRIKLEEKGSPNGVATLDEEGKIPNEQLPMLLLDALEHIKHTIYKDGVHGLRVNHDGILQYLNESNEWVDVILANDAVGKGDGVNQFLNVSIKVENGKVDLTYYGIPTVTSQKWTKGDYNLTYFESEGIPFNGNDFIVNEVGIHTLWYQDSNGNKYNKVFNVTAEDLNRPNFNVEVIDGVVTVDVNRPLTLKKWDKGQRDVPYFQANGNVFTGSAFEVTESGFYTIYVKDNDNNEYVHIFEVTDEMLNLPFINTSVSEGIVTVTYNTDFTIELSKYATGNRVASYFENEGVVYTGNTFEVTEVGTYTVYHKYTNNTTMVKVFEVTEDMLPTAPDDVTPPTFRINTIGNYTGDIKNGAVSVIITQIQDEGSGVSHMLLPDGTRVDNPPTRIEYKIKTNGSHKFELYDNAGNKSEQTVDVICIGTPINISQQPLGKRFYFCGQDYVLIEKNNGANTIVEYENRNIGAHQATFDYDNATNLFPNASIRSYLANAFGISGTLNEEEEIIQDAQWNYGLASGQDATWTQTTNQYVSNFAGLMTLPQITNALYKNWIDFETTYSEWTLTPSDDPNYYNAVYTARRNMVDDIIVVSEAPNELRSFRLAYQVTNNAIAYV